jgi:predicted NodU family carbamoyl transferase
MRIIGISAFYHDSAAALVQDGRIIAAAQEERFTRKKHDQSFPVNALRYCLEEGGLKPEEIDHVAFYDKPFLKFERLLETYLAFAPRATPPSAWHCRSGSARSCSEAAPEQGAEGARPRYRMGKRLPSPSIT